MDQPNHTLNRNGQEAGARLAPHMPALTALGAAVAPQRGELLARWKLQVEQDTAYPELARLSPLAEQLDHAARIWLENFTRTSLPLWLNDASAWSEELYTGGLGYRAQMRLWTHFRRALLPIVHRAESNGPEAALAFDALDALESTITGLAASANIRELQKQLTLGAHQRSVGRLAGGVAHSLNNTMAVIVGRAQILEEQVADETQREELRALQRVARAGADSLRRLQQFADERDVEPVRLDVNTLVSDVLQLTRFRWRDDAEASGITIDVVKDLVNVPPVIGQPALLRDALVELIMNGVEAMPLGGLITVRTEHVKDRVEIAVTDQGEGMDAAMQARAHEPFFTTKGPGHAGLGLGMVRGILQQMGGSLALDSEPGKGTKAVLYLPAAQEIKQAQDLRPARLARWASILVVDDEPLVRDVAARTFHLRGFRAVAADSGADAIRLFTEQGPFEVMVVDLGMPHMNGFETARAIKELNPRTIIILMTGWAAEIDIKKMRDAGIDRAISKPFDADQVIALISEALAFQLG